MATGWETFGNVLGGGIDRAGAFEQGRLRTAQTESALGLARQRQLENVSLEAKNRAQEQFRESLAKSGMLPPEQVDLAANVTLGELGSDFNSTMSGLETGQEIGFRNTLADPAADPAVRQLAGQGVQGKVLSPYEIQGNMVSDLRTPDVAPVANDLGEAMIDSNTALAELRRTQAGDPDYSTVSGSGSTGPGGLKPPSGKVLNPAYDATKPVGPGNYPFLDGVEPPDINTPRPLGMNALTQFTRVINAAGNTALDLATIVSMPSGASSGWFGKPNDKGIMSMVPANLANSVTPAEVQQYRAIMGTLGEQLATIERTGMRGSAGLADRFNDLALLPNDDVFTKMLKLAQMRQTVENGMDTLMSLNNLPDSIRARVETVRNSVNKSIPFTPRDVLEFQQAGATNPGLTFAQMLEQKGASFDLNDKGMVPQESPGRTLGGQAILPPNPRGQELPTTNEKGWILLEDGQGNLAYVSPDGTQIEEVQ